MILADTSVWVDHLRRGEPLLAAHLEAAEVLSHPWVVGELLLGNLPVGSPVTDLLRLLPRAVVATDDEVHGLVVREQLGGSGIGYVDAQLLASARLTPGAALWTRDVRLQEAGLLLGVALVEG